MQRLSRVLGVIATLGMFVVLVLGSAVTNTGSEHGCGRSWPLCHGQFIPSFTFTTLVEFVHRAAAGTETILTLALSAVALYLYRNRTEIRILVAIMIGFLFLQAGLGAWAVMVPQSAVILAAHFGVSLTAFAGVLLTTAVLFELPTADRFRSRPVPLLYRCAVWGLTAYTVIVVYIGAYVRHSDADDACSGWPLCNGALVPNLQGKVENAFAHRAAAGFLVLLVIALAAWSWRLRADRPDLSRAALLAAAAVILQAGIGAAVAVTHVSLGSALLHSAGAGLLFGTLSYLCMQVLPLQTAPALSRAAVPAAARPEPATAP